jgi:putative ABC transport system permease protein
MQFRQRIRAAMARAGRVPDETVVEELALHAAAMHASARADGAPADEAERRVDQQIALWCDDAVMLRRRGDSAAVHEEPPAGVSGLAGLGHDVRYALRLLRRRPGAMVVTVLTMAMGIGATTVLASVAWGVLFRPLPWPDADRLVRVVETREGSTQPLPPIFTNGTYLAWRDAPATIEQLAGWSPRTVTLTGTGDPQRIRVASVTPSLFPLLRARPAIGSVFDPGDAPGADTTAVILSHGLWQQLFGGNPAVLGRTIHFDGAPRTVVGVMPPAFAFPDRGTRAWTYMTVTPVLSPDGSRSFISIFSAVARLRPGVTPEQAAAEAAARGNASPDHGMTAMAVFGSRGAVKIRVVPLLEHMTADVRPALFVFLAAVGLLLATATANVASVQLARATTRRREMAVRSALGAGSARLARQLLVENLLLGLMGGALGLVAAWWLHRALPSVLPADFPRLDELAMDPRAAGLALVLSVAVSVAFGLWPILQTRRLNMVDALADDGQAPSGAGRTGAARARTVIMAGQVAVAAVLLIGASLLTRTFVAMLAADRGYDVTGVLVARLPLPAPSFTPQRRAELLGRIIERLERTPGVSHAAFTTVLPLETSDAMMAFTIPPPPGSSDPGAVQARFRVISPSYFRAMGIRLLEGRALGESDTAASQPVILVNRAFARQYLGDRPLGRRLPANLVDEKPDWEVVGIVDDIHMRSLTEAPHPEIFVSYRQVVSRGDTFQPTLVVRTAGPAAAFAPTLAETVRSEDASVALDGVATMEQRLFGSLARPYLYAVLLGSFAFFAVAIAAVGLFGVLSYTVALRSREIAVRSALGARPFDIVRLVVGQVMTVTLSGLAVGLAASAILGRSLASFLYGVAAADVTTYVWAAVVLLAVSAIAACVPARRAAKLDPLKVLKAG